MYFTIDEREPSSAIQDARRSFNTIRSQAAALAGLSASFQEQASEVTSSYRRALADGTESSWARFIYAASDIAQHGQAVEELLGCARPNAPPGAPSAKLRMRMPTCCCANPRWPPPKPTS